MQKLLTIIRSRYQGWLARRVKSAAGSETVMTDAHAQRLEQARVLHQEARLDEAQAIYREMLRQYPRDFDLLMSLGALQGQRGDFADATRSIEQALAINPDSAAAYSNLGNCRKCTGQFEAALVSYDQALRLEKTADTLVNRGATLTDLGRYDDAVDSFNQALSLLPSHIVALDCRGVAYARLGRHEEALASHQEAAALDPDNHQMWSNAAIVAVTLKKFDVALMSYEQALLLRPDDVTIHNNRGAVLTDLGRHEEAILSFAKAISIAPDYIDAFMNRGATLWILERYDEALHCYDQVLMIDADHVRARVSRGTCLASMERREEALTEFDIVLDAHPEDVEALTCRGGLLHFLDRDDEGLECLHRAIAIKPDAADAIYNCGIIHMELSRHEEALMYFEQACAIKPMPRTLGNRGVVLVNLRRHAEAMDCYSQAQAIKDTPEIRYNISICQLQLGDFQSGFEGYEWRWEANTSLKMVKPSYTQPKWSGAEPISGKTVLLYGEQGYGDTLQMCRFVKHVAARGAKVILVTQSGLQHLLADTEGASQVVEAGATLPLFDYHCSLMSLPLALGITLETVPVQIPYVRSRPARVARWREQLGDRVKPRIGLAWSGNKTHKNDKNRSLPLAQLQPLLTGGFEWISLQQEVREADEKWLRDCAILHVGEQLRNYTDTAALVELMDVVVTVDTSVAHLAGAMGKPVWILLPFDSDWRWLLDRDDSPWYPTARLFRQPVQHDWDSVIATVRTELARELHPSSG